MLSYLFFFLEEILSWPESDSESELELELLEEELESELESEAWPDPCWRSILSAMAASWGCSFLRTLYHLLLNFGLPLTVLCQTMGKLVIPEIGYISIENWKDCNCTLHSVWKLQKFTVTLLYQKFRESNVLEKENTKVSIWRIFWGWQ